MSVSGVSQQASAYQYHKVSKSNSTAGGQCSSSCDTSSTEDSSASSLLDLLDLSSADASTGVSGDTTTSASDDAADPLQTLVADIQNLLSSFGSQEAGHGQGGHPPGPPPGSRPGPPPGPPPGGVGGGSSSATATDSTSASDETDSSETDTSFAAQLQKLMKDLQTVLKSNSNDHLSAYDSTGATTSSVDVGSLLDSTA